MLLTKIYLTIKHDMSQSEREGSRVTEDNAATKERMVDAQADVEAVQKNAEGNVPVGLRSPTESNQRLRQQLKTCGHSVFRGVMWV